MVIIWIESAVSDIWHISKHNFARRMTWTHFPQHLMIPQLLKLEMIVFLTLCGTVCATHPTLPPHLMGRPEISFQVTQFFEIQATSKKRYTTTNV